MANSSLQPPHREAPILETDRLRLRGHTPADLEASLRMWSEPQVYRFIGGKPATLEEAWARLLRYAGSWSMLGFGFWLIEEKASGRFLGEAGFLDGKRALEPAFGDAPECGWGLVPSAHGHGFASEMLAAILAWGEQTFAQDRFVCMIDPDNQPSLRLAERCGFRPYAEGVYKDVSLVLLERPRGVDLSRAHRE